MFVRDTEYECPYCKTPTLEDKQREIENEVQDIKQCRECGRIIPAFRLEG